MKRPPGQQPSILFTFDAGFMTTQKFTIAKLNFRRKRPVAMLKVHILNIVACMAIYVNIIWLAATKQILF